MNFIINNIKKIKGHKSSFKFLLHLIKSKIVFIIGDFLPFLLPLSIFKYKRHNYFLHYAPNQFSQVLYTYPDIIRHPGDEEFLKAYLKSGDNYIDIGANIGTTTLCATVATSANNTSIYSDTSIPRDGLTIAYEAHPLTFTYLTRSILNNKNLIPRIITRNIALGDSDGEVAFSTIENHDDINHVINDANDQEEELDKKINSKTYTTNNLSSNKNIIYVPIKKLDDELTFSKINLIKIDVEGYELQVFNGAKDTLTKTEAIFFEIYDKNAEMFNYKTIEIINLLSDAGFKIYKIDMIHKTLKSLDKHAYSGSPQCENMIAVRNESNLCSRTGYVIIYT